MLLLRRFLSPRWGSCSLLVKFPRADARGYMLPSLWDWGVLECCRALYDSRDAAA